MRGLDLASFLAIAIVYILAIWNVLPKFEKVTRPPLDRSGKQR